MTVLTPMHRQMYRPQQVADALRRAIAALGAPPAVGWRLSCGTLEKEYGGPRASSIGYTAKHHLVDVQALMGPRWIVGYVSSQGNGGQVGYCPAYLTVEVACRS